MKFHKTVCLAMYALLVASFTLLSLLPWHGLWYALAVVLLAAGVAVSAGLYYRFVRLRV